MSRRWIVAAPLPLLFVGWLCCASHGPTPLASHPDVEEVAVRRAFSPPPLLDDTLVDIAPTPLPPPRARASAARLPDVKAEVKGGGGAKADAEDDDVKEGINAVADVDYARAASKFEHACARGSAFACGALGKLLATGTGVTKNVPRGRTFLGRGCNATETWACNDLESIHGEEKPAP
jgi:hypothetical protein